MKSLVAMVGFTLIEVLIALAILAISLTAIIKATGNDIAGTARITNQTLANFVAHQAVTMIQLKLLPLTYQNGAVNQVTEMLGQKWYWEAQVFATSDPYVGRLSIKVFQGAGGAILQTLQAYVAVEPSYVPKK